MRFWPHKAVEEVLSEPRVLRVIAYPFFWYTKWHVKHHPEGGSIWCWTPAIAQEVGKLLMEKR